MNYLENIFIKSYATFSLRVWRLKEKQHRRGRHRESLHVKFWRFANYALTHSNVAILVRYVLAKRTDSCIRMSFVDKNERRI